MFSEKQVLSISGHLNDTKPLEKAIAYAMELSGRLLPFEEIVYQEGAHSSFAIGKAFTNVDGEAIDIPDGWAKIPFATVHILTEIVKQAIESCGAPNQNGEKGFLLKAATLPECLAENLVNPKYAFCIIYPYNIF